MGQRLDLVRYLYVKKFEWLKSYSICISSNNMAVSLNYFETLCQRYPAWHELYTFLEGESIRVIPNYLAFEGGEVIPASDTSHAVLRYVKGKNTSATTDVFRSVIWNTKLNRPLCVAPIRATEGLPPMNVQLSATEDFVDGFMMNAWVADDGVLHIATRTQIGGGNTFYGDKTFGQMFKECIQTSVLKTMDILRDTLNTMREEMKVLSVFASFVIQHPDHRVVAKVMSPSLNIVHVGTVRHTGVVDIAERATNWPQALARLQIPSYPVRLFHSEKDIQDLLRQTGVQRGWRWQGLVFKDGKGGRWRLRTPTYTLMRELRGSESNPLDRFFRLRTSNQVMEYLKHYSEDRDMFWEYEQQLRARTTGVLNAYADVHKAHTVKFKELPEALRPAVYMLHVVWRDELRAKGFTVRLQNAIQVINAMRDFEKVRLMQLEPYVSISPLLS